VYLGVPGQILKLDKTSTDGGATILASNVASSNRLVVDPPSGALYYSDWGSGTGTDGTVGKVPLDGGSLVQLHGQLVTPESIAVNGKYVFWLSNDTNAPGSSSGTNPGTGALYRGKK
jgi:sugar lactone lactonase YvrE